MPSVPDPRQVFVIHGRNESARKAMFGFLRSLGLQPIEWDQAVAFTGQGAPYVGEILDRAFERAQAVIVLLTGDDLARLGTRHLTPTDPGHESELTPQARPNVLFEAGMALARQPTRTILVELGRLRPFSDLYGRHTLKMGDGSAQRQALRDRLERAGCLVETTGRADWHHEGGFDAAIQSPDVPLKLSLSSPRGERARYGGPAGPWAYFYHIRVENKSVRLARRVGIELTRVNKATAGGSFPDRPLPTPVKLKWAHKEKDPDPCSKDVPGKSAATCNLGHIIKDLGFFELNVAIEPKPADFNVGVGERLRVEAVADNAESSRLQVEIAWDGTWSDAPETMRDHLVVRAKASSKPAANPV